MPGGPCPFCSLLNCGLSVKTQLCYHVFWEAFPETSSASVSEVLHISSLVDPECPSVLALNRVHLGCLVYFLHCLWTLEDSDCSLYVFLPSASQMFIYTEGKIAFIVLLWIMVKLHTGIGKIICTYLWKNISSPFVNFFNVSIRL